MKPEAVVTINEFTIDVGGLTGQPKLAFLYPDWIDELKANPLSFICSGFNVDEPVAELTLKQE